MWPDTDLMDRLGISLPILQAPMAGHVTQDMVVAVCEAGGLGALGAAVYDPETLRNTIRGVQQQTDRPFNVNFFAHTDPAASDDSGWLARLGPYFEEAGLEPPDELPVVIPSFNDDQCTVLEDTRPAVVSFHFGLPSAELVARVKATGAIIMSSATTVEEAEWLAGHGCDVVIAQGYEAGGHRGMFLTGDVTTQIGTLSLVPQIVDAIDLPVIAAGGIADGRGVAAALALGASAAMLGTAYLATAETGASALHQNVLRSRDAGHSAITNIFSGKPARCVVNRAVREIGPMAGDVAAFPKGFVPMGMLKGAAEKDGRADFSAHYAGQSAPLNRAKGARQLTQEVAHEALLIVARLAGQAEAGDGYGE